MTDAPDQVPETPVERRRRRSAAAWALIAGMVVVALVAMVFLGGRLAVLSPAGRDLVVSFVAGKQLGRYGRINVEGLSGDLWSDFTLDRVTVTDAEGVWLEAHDVRVDWSYWRLVTRTFHADRIEAGMVRFIRRPLVEPSVDPPGAMPLSVNIRAFEAELELLEDFSKEYGRWRISANANVPRQQGRAQTGEVRAFSRSRPGDFLIGGFRYGGGLEDLRLNLRAREARGGPLAGSLGYSPDRPFLLNAEIDDEKLTAVVRSGDFTPLNVRGDFDAENVRLSGYAVFTGSDLLSDFVRRIGPTARFGLAAVRSQTDPRSWGVGWELRAENLTSRARGTYSPGDNLTPHGVRISVATPSLTRLVGTTLGGPAAYEGLWRGDPENWTLDGAASLQGATLAGYRLTRMSGPLQLVMRNGRLDAAADLAGTGGSGTGIVGGLFGATPTARVELTRHADGRILLSRIDARGEAIRVEGSGSRALNGGLAFNGEIDVSDITRVRRGASGGFSGDIRARQARPGRDWTLGFDVRGRRFATGYGQLDRLLGPTPRLVASGGFQSGAIAIEQAALTGSAGRMNARGLIGMDGDLRLALNWNAQGPFAVGPVEIEGGATGQGALTGSLNRPRADLTARFDQIAAGPLTLTSSDVVLSFRQAADASHGRITVTGDSNYGPARAASSFMIVDNGVSLSNLDIDAGGLRAAGALALRNGAPSSADLTFVAGPGAFLASGNAEGRVRLTEGAGNETAILDVTGRNVRFSGSTYVIRTLDLSGRGTLERLPFTLTTDVGGDIPLRFNGSGVYSRQGQTQTVALEGAGRVREVNFTTRAPAVAVLAGASRLLRVDLAVGRGALTGELRQNGAGAVIEANLSEVQLQSLNENLRGLVSGAIALSGAGDDLSGSADLRFTGAGSRDAPRDMAIDGLLRARLAGDQLAIDATMTDDDGVNSRANLILPVEASAAPLRLAIVRNRPMSGDVTLAGQIQPIWDLMFGGERSLSGQVSASARVAGTINEPRLNGRVDLTGGAFRDAFTGARLADLTFGARFDGEGAVVERFTATDGAGGTVTGQGRLDLRQGGASSFTLALNRFRVIDNDVASARASGPVTASRDVEGGIKLEGDLTIDEARVAANPPTPSGVVSMDVVEINRPGGDPDRDERAERAERPSGIALDVRLRATDGDVRVVGRGLDVHMNLNARVRGTLSTPILTGTARVVRGDYEFAGKRFVFDTSGSVTLSTRPDRIRLNLRAVREDPALTAEIRVTGTAAQPNIALSSSPSLPQDEILSQVLFGRSASQLSAIEAAQLASGVASLTGGGGFDILGNLAEFAGLDRLSFGGDASAMTVAGGRYLSDDVYFEIIGGGEGGAAVQVEWQARRNIAVTSRVDGQGDASLAIRWRRQTQPEQRGPARTTRVPVED